MKCANEIKKMVEYGMTTGRAIYTKEWCEEVIAPMLEKNALELHKAGCTVWFDGTPESTVVHQLSAKSCSDYSDNRLCADVVSGEIDIAVLKDYLKQFCYTLDIRCGNRFIADHPYWKYGWGECKATVWEIKPAPDCK